MSQRTRIAYFALGAGLLVAAGEHFGGAWGAALAAGYVCLRWSVMLEE